MPRQHLLHALEYAAARRSGRTDGEHFVQTPAVQLRFHARKRENPLQLRREYPLPVPYRVEQRFDPAAVPEQKQAVLHRVQYGEGKDAVQALDKLRPVLHVAGENDLRVAGGEEGVAAVPQLLP